MDDSTMADGKARCDGLLSVSSMSRSDPTNYFSEFGAVGWIIVRFYRHEPALVSRSRVRQKAIFDKSVKWSIREPSPPHHIEIFIGWSFFGLVKAYVLVLGSFLLFLRSVWSSFFFFSFDEHKRLSMISNRIKRNSKTFLPYTWILKDILVG